MSSIRIFDIQRTSLVDGPGVRTTVFFKGCNLRCRWCHNPESQRFEPELLLHKNKCTGCGICRAVCPNGLTHCTACGKCADTCAAGARELAGRDADVEEVFAEVCKDARYYERSGGGVTCSGGECMLQTGALTELLRLCREAGIHTAVDTAGCVPWESFEAVSPYTDLFLYDVKGMDEEAHIRNTGKSNRLILENLSRLAELAPEKILVRIPVIPGVNDTDDEMEAMAAFLRERELRAVELLPYHRMGEHKYADLGRQAENFSVPSAEALLRCREKFDRI